MDVIETLEALVRFDTCNPFRTVTSAEGETIGLGNGRYEIHRFLASHLRDAGFRVRRQQLTAERTVVTAGGSEHPIPERHNLLAEKGEGERSLLLFGHVDTVPVKEGWTVTTPFEPRRARRSVEDLGEQDVLYGLGSNDMKAGLAVMLHAARAFTGKGYKLKLAFLEDEEFWSFGAHKLLEEREFLCDVAAALVPELGDTEQPHRGARQIMLGRMGRVEFEFSIPGRSCHGAFARQGTGHNAVEDLGVLINRLTEYCGAESERVLHYAGGRSIRNAAFLNHAHGGERMLSVPESARLYLDRSFLPLEGESRAEELVRLETLVRELYSDGRLRPVDREGRQLRIGVREAPRPSPPSDPYLVPEDHPFTRFLAHRIANCFDTEACYAVGNSVADENVIAAALPIPVLVVGPIGRGAHEPDEWVATDSVRELNELYTDVVNRFPDFLAARGQL